MDFDNAKENIQPLSTGRNATILQAALNLNLELNKIRESYESAIHQYEGDDPLQPWFDYILWIEQSYPSGGSESGLKKVLLECLGHFESDHRYFQDRRMIRIYIKYIDSESDPQALYEELYNAGVGTMVADLYICWAFYYDLLGNFSKTEKIFQLGFRAKAQPYDELEQAHKHFGFTMSQRLLYKDDDSSKESIINSLRERRHALTSLRSNRKLIGSVRTGTAVKSHNPGRIDTGKNIDATKNYNKNVNVYQDQNNDPNIVLPTEEPKTVVRNIIDSARKQENLREPGPWNNHNVKQKGSLLSNKTITTTFDILEDTDYKIVPLPTIPRNYEKGIVLLKNFAIKNFPQSKWTPKPITETELLPQVISMYPKFYCYPNNEEEFSVEEYMAYLWFKKYKPDNNFIQRYLIFWGNNYMSNIRLFPNFPKNNIPDKNHLELSEFDLFECSDNMTVDVNDIYKNGDEKQMEELFAEQWLRIKQQRGECTILTPENIDETTCGNNVSAVGSIFPSRKSMAPAAASRKSVYFIKSEIKKDNLPKRTNSPSIDHDLNYLNTEKNISITEKNVLKDNEIKYIEIESEGNVLLKSSDQNKSFNYVDNKIEANENDLNKNELLLEASNTTDFKIPLPRKSLKSKVSFQIYQDDEECSDNYFASNETFSTQTFNLNIKTQSVSTPISNKSNKTSKIDFVKSPLEVAVECVEPQKEGSPDADSTEFLKQSEVVPKQLSVIMEETSTNTKSSVETQTTDDSSRIKTCPTLDTLSKELTLNTMPDYRNLGAKPKNSSYHYSKDENKPVESNEGNLRTDLKSSIRIYEDKTETVPQVVLTKKQDIALPVLNDKSLIFENSKFNDNKHISFSTQNSVFNSENIEKSVLIADNMNAFTSKLYDLTLPELEISNNKFNSLNMNSCLKNIASKVKDHKHKQNSNFNDEDMDKLSLVARDVISSPSKLTHVSLPEILDTATASNVNSVKRDSYENIYNFFKTSPLKNVPLEFNKSLVLPILNINSSNFENEASNITKMGNEDELKRIFETSPNSKNDSRTLIENNSYHHLANNYDFHTSHINEKSLHIKTEVIEEKSIQRNENNRKKSILQRFSEIKLENTKNNSGNNVFTINKANDEDIKSEKALEVEKEEKYIDPDIEINNELSIYYDHTPKLISLSSDNDHINDKTCNFFAPQSTKSVDIDNSNPFSPELIRAFLEQIEFINYLQERDTCEIIDNILSLKQTPNITICNKNFNILKKIGVGGYANVYSAQDKSGKIYALKQEYPANLWEYYICLELCSRIKNVDMIKSFMDIEYAIIASNSSIFVTEFSKFGTLITVCNKINRLTSKKVNEFIVMILTDQLLSIVDHLHSCHIIHGDIKPDNILLMNQISLDTNIPVIKLIDFGVSIDMGLFRMGQTFQYQHKKDDFKCIEMRENRPWTYQVDLYGIAGVIHVLLFGKFMTVEKKSIWQPTHKVPRYFSKLLWDTIFSQLLNVRDCNTLPNLQNLRTLLKEEISVKEKFVKEKICEFNILLNK